MSGSCRHMFTLNYICIGTRVMCKVHGRVIHLCCLRAIPGLGRKAIQEFASTGLTNGINCVQANKSVLCKEL